jgi:hypothetical protein
MFQSPVGDVFTAVGTVFIVDVEWEALMTVCCRANMLVGNSVSDNCIEGRCSKSNVADNNRSIFFLSLMGWEEFLKLTKLVYCDFGEVKHLPYKWTIKALSK